MTEITEEQRARALELMAEAAQVRARAVFPRYHPKAWADISEAEKASFRWPQSFCLDALIAAGWRPSEEPKA